MRQVLLHRGEDGFWIAECPSLPGCVSQGENQETALANVREAIQAYVAALEADNLPVPEDHFDACFVTVSAISPPPQAVHANIKRRNQEGLMPLGGQI